MDAKKKALLELIKQMQKLMAEDGGDEPMSLGDVMKDVEDEMVEGSKPEENGEDEPVDDALAEKKQFMKGNMPPPKGKALSISFMSLKKPKGKALKHG